MKSQATKQNQRLISRYTDQPEVMPASVRTMIEEAWNGQPVQLYALADLDPALRLTQTWIALGPDDVAIVRMGKDGARPELGTFARTRIKSVKESTGLSSMSLTIQADPNEPALARIRYTYRQRQAMGAIHFVLNQEVEGRKITPENPDAAYCHAIADPIKRAQAATAENKSDVIWRLIGYLKPYTKKVIIGLLGGFLVTLLSLLPPEITGRLIDQVLDPYMQGTLSLSDAQSMGWILLGIIIVVFIFRELFLWLRLRTMTYVGELVARDLRKSVYDHLHKLSVNYFSNHQTGSIITRVSSDTDRIWDFIAFGVTDLALSMSMVLGLSIVLLYSDWRLGLVLIIPVPMIFFFIIWMGKQLHRIFLRIWRQWSAMTSVLSDTIPGIRVVKAFNQADYERNRFNNRSNAVMNEAFAIHNLWTTYWPLIYFFLNMMVIMVWAFALPRLFGDGTAASITLTKGTFVKFLLYMGMFIMPIENFGFLTRMINRSLSSAYRVFEVLDTEPDIVVKDKPIRLEPVEGKIEFRDVTFGYDSVRQIIKGISLEVNPGEMIGLVGPSGAGKTTVINLIARFFDANSGKVLIDGHDINDLDLGHYRLQLGMVLQDPFLFHGSIMDNIRYGHHDAELSEIVEAAKAANAHDFICKLPQGYETTVGERGHTLSGGERQRVSIARAILHNPRILILDEATSSVDTETERNIQEAIERLVSGRTVLAIAHRLSTLRKATRLFVMKDGKIVESGPHEELLAKEDGLYRKLHEMQRELHEMYAV